jgi:phenylalanine-4-hydroxylase
MHEHDRQHITAIIDLQSRARLPVFLEQDYTQYDAEAHAVWRTLYERRVEALRDTGSAIFLQGMEAIGLSADRIPELADINKRLATQTEWAAVGVNGFIPAAQFFRCLAHRRFPTALIVRPRTQLDYLPEPDIFHDVFGHVPMHSNPVFADFLQRFGDLGAYAASEEDTVALSRLFWFTVEFGLIRENGEVKIYGSGLISSQSDAANALSSRCKRQPFCLETVLQQPFQIDRIQDVLFIIESFDQLFDAVKTLQARKLRTGHIC